MQASAPALTKAKKNTIQMTQADCVFSTPPTNTPIDTRRRFITIAAGASIVSVSSLVTAAAPPNATPEVSSAPVDPIHALPAG
jgi:hypothetical protein